MKVGVFGTGMVGEAIASRLITLGHEVMMGSREAQHAKTRAWSERMGERAHGGTFAQAGSFGSLLFNCTQGAHSLAALRSVPERALDDKVLVDVANMLSPSKPMASSLGEQIQDAFPRVKVVKALNTINSALMVEPGSLAGHHTLFVSGNDAAAKQQVTALLRTFGWQDVLDLGDITTARATEAYLSLWLSLWKTLGTLHFNVQVVR